MPEDLERAIRARSIWSGTISFGLVSIPVNLFSANRPGGVSLRMLDEDGTPLARRYYDPETGEEVPRDRLVRGYEIEEGEFVLVTERELESVEPEKSRDIDLRRFVPIDQIDPVYFERAYFLAPDGRSTKAYRLLAAVMEDTGRAGIATFVMRTKEYLVAILAENGILRAETLRFHDEVRDVSVIDLPEEQVDGKAVTAMKKAIRAGTRDELDTSELEDDYARRLRSLVESKRDRKADLVSAPRGAEEEEGEEVIDLMDVLKRSLRGGEAAARRTRRAGEAGTAPAADTLRGLTKAELYQRAQELDISGRSSMNKDELVDAIRRSA
ncbi:MAG: Ku protein [Gemmatimonadota bacterium]